MLIMPGSMVAGSQASKRLGAYSQIHKQWAEKEKLALGCVF